MRVRPPSSRSEAPAIRGLFDSVPLTWSGLFAPAAVATDVRQNRMQPRRRLQVSETAKDIVRGFFTSLNDGDFDTAFRHVSDDVEWWVPGELPFSGTKTKAEYLVVVEAIRGGFPGGLQFTVTNLIAEGDQVAAEVSSLGEHASGRTYANRYHFLFTLRGGVIVAVKEYMDTQHLAQLIA